MEFGLILVHHRSKEVNPLNDNASGEMTKWFLLTFLLIAICTPGAYAATINANSCSAPDVQTAINSAASGDTVTIPAGDCVWSTQVTVTGVCITLQGASESGTIIEDNLALGTSGLVVSNIPVTCQPFRFANLTYKVHGGASFYQLITFAGNCTSSTCSSIRFDHVTLPNIPSPIGGQYAIFVTNCFGVVDHNNFTLNHMVLFNVLYSNYLGVGADGDNSWAQPDAFGSQSALYFEDNTLTAISGKAAIHDCDGDGCRVVVRFNTLTAGNLAYHGTETPARHRGGRHFEWYGNSFVANSSNYSNMTNPRSGTGFMFGNTVTHAGNFTPTANTLMALTLYRANDTFTPAFFGTCDGEGPFDKNDGATTTAPSRVTAVSGNTLSDNTRSWATNQFAPGTNYYSIVDTTTGWEAGIVSNTGSVLTFTGANNQTAPSVGDSYQIIGTTLYAHGRATGANGSAVLTDSTKNWGTGQWVNDGAPYSIRNITQSWGREIASSTADTVTSQGSELGQTASWNNGDSYAILRATVCIDQQGRGQGSYISGQQPAPIGWVSQSLQPIYEFADSIDQAPGFGIITTDTARLVANRDFYQESVNQTAQTSPGTPFNGSSGNGHGTLANRPAICATGVGYWATDQGNWNHSTNKGQSMGYGFGQGQLFVCTATNTWSPYYTPYTYPHPLETGTLPDPPAAPTSLTATVQ